MNSLINRIEEKQRLSDFLRSGKAEFLAVYGRRRVGKSFLVKSFFSKEKCIFFHATGIKDGKLHEQIHEFTKQVGDTFYDGVEIKPQPTWLGNFELLNKAIDKVDKRKKVVLFLDELPWMATKKSRLLQALEYYWNRFWNWDKRVKLIVCGSSSSWILKKIINNTGGLYNRVTSRIKLAPFDLDQSKKMLLANGVKLNNNQIVEIYMAIGGIPLYLEKIKKGMTAKQNINSLCFSEHGFLQDEFPNLIKSLFDDSDIYLALLKNIAQYRYGIGKRELAKKSKLSLGGRFTGRLTDLEESGFITSFVPYGHKERGTYYKVSDEYTLFYFNWIESNTRSLAKKVQNNFWLSMANSPTYNSWAGYAFETICYKHISRIIDVLDIKNVRAVGSWRYAPYKEKEKSGAQIDLLFDRDDGAITLCEIKYTEKPFIIDKEYAHKLRRKVKVFTEQTKTNKQIFVVMISANGIKKNKYSEDLLTNIVTLADLFGK